jgi:phage terminase large subunit
MARAAQRSRSAVDYVARSQFNGFHQRDKRWAVIVAHRRAGKTVACVMELLTRALATSKKDARYAYIAPYREQAKTVAWAYLKQYAANVVKDPAEDFRESDLTVRLFNGSHVRLFGADNPNALRGMYLDGVVMDEYADMRPSLWGEVIRPTLSDRKGWAVFIGTPRGKNEFWDVYDNAGRDEAWFRLTLKASETQILPEPELIDARKTMTENQYAQEYECSFDAAIIGAVYAKELKLAYDKGRVRKVPYDGAKLVFAAFDIGRRDATAIWFYQIIQNEIRVLDYFEDNMETATYYASVLKGRDYKYDTLYLPHDADKGEAATGVTFAEVMRDNGFRVEVLKPIALEDGINAARMLFPKCIFDADKCQPGLEALQSYRWDYNIRMGELKNAPVHDWASHGADAFRYLALSVRSGIEDRPRYKALTYPKRAYV